MWIFGRLVTDPEILAERLGRSGILQAFTGQTLVVVHGREIAIRGLLVREQGQRLSPALDAPVELGVGLEKRAGLQIRATK